MPYTKCYFSLVSILILIGALAVFSPAIAASDQPFSLPQGDIDRIDTYIQSRMQIANIPGLALGVVYGDEVVYLRGYGIVAPDGRAVTPQTPFILGSTSKSFTALAVMQLVEAGKIDLDAPSPSICPGSARATQRHPPESPCATCSTKTADYPLTQVAWASRITTRVVWRLKMAFEISLAYSSVSQPVNATNTPTKITTYWD
ncbi:MAG: beta-lactamase family protein [Chloroflexi bacterium]|nr:beta-lactamase family protein [Chloroflexota bacterium]